MFTYIIMPMDMKKKMAKLRAMRKPKRGGKCEDETGADSPFTDDVFGETCYKDKRERQLKQSAKRASQSSRSFTREEWDILLNGYKGIPGINTLFPPFGAFMSKMLILDDFQKGRIDTKGLAKAAVQEGYNQWVKPRIDRELKSAGEKILQKIKGGKGKKKAKKGGSASPFLKWLYGDKAPGKPETPFARPGADPLESITGLIEAPAIGADSPASEALGLPKGPFTSEEVDLFTPILKKINPFAGKLLEAAQKGKKFLEQTEDVSEEEKQEIREAVEQAIEEYVDLFGDRGCFPDSLAEPNAARRGCPDSKGKAGFGKKGGCMMCGRGQNGLAGNPSTNPQPEQYVIPVPPPNANTTKGANRGAMSGWAPLGRSPNANSFAQVSF